MCQIATPAERNLQFRSERRAICNCLLLSAPNYKFGYVPSGKTPEPKKEAVLKKGTGPKNGPKKKK